MRDIQKIKTDLKKSLSPKRYEHSLLVAEEAKSLASQYHVDPEKAYITALLHDNAKDLSDKEIRKWFEIGKLPKELLEEDYKELLHADISAVIARCVYHLKEDEVEAISAHTIGHIPMTILDKIVFLADKIGRKNLNPDMKKVKDMAYQDLDKALIIFLKQQRKYLLSKNIIPNKKSEELLLYLQQVEKEKTTFSYLGRYESFLGTCFLVSDGKSLTGLYFEGQKYFPKKKFIEEECPVFAEVRKWLDIYFSGKEPEVMPQIKLEGTIFQQKVWKKLLEIPYGTTTTYKNIALDLALAKEEGKKSISMQAIGGAVSHNPISILIPCHRVIGSSGNLVGYAGGLDRKKALLELEKVKFK